MIVDFHTHLLPASFRGRRDEIARRDATFASLFAGVKMANIANIDELIFAMDEDGVDVSVVLGYGWCDFEVAREANDYLLEAAARFPERIVPFCSAHPGWGELALAEIERCLDGGAKGIGELHPASQGIDLMVDPSLEPLASLASREGVPILVHGSEPLGHQYPGKGTTTPDKLLGLAQRFAETTFVFAHWGGGLPFYGLMPEVAEDLKNVYFDSAASPFLYDNRVFDIVARSIGASHILFGSDFPLVRARRALDEVIKVLEPEDARAVFAQNAACLLRWTDD